MALRRVRLTLSSWKWLALSAPSLLGSAKNPFRLILRAALLPIVRKDWTIALRNGLVLTAPATYSFQSIAETVFLDVYHVAGARDRTVVDVGASIGDFTLVAAYHSGAVVHAFETEPHLRSALSTNVRNNDLRNVVVHTGAATVASVRNVLSDPSTSQPIFLKLDCEGCEFDILSGLTSEDLAKVNEVHFEIHPDRNPNSIDLVRILSSDKHFVTQVFKCGGCSYVHATRAAGQAPV